MPGRLPARSERSGGFRDRAEGDREYRRGGAEKKVGPGSDFKPEFVCFIPHDCDLLLIVLLVYAIAQMGAISVLLCLVSWLPAE